MMQQRKSLKIMMADHVPFDIQTIIIKKLPAKSLIRFRSVSKQWKSLIDSSEFIKNYHSMNDPHLLVRYNVQQYNDETYEYVSIIDEYVSIIDNETFPHHMSPMTVPLSVKTLERARKLCSPYEPARILGSSCGLICFHGYHKDHSEMVVFWNPSIRKSVSVMLEPPVRLGMGTGWVGFGVCPETCDPKLVKIANVKGILEVHVYTLSTRAWKKVSVRSQYKSCRLLYHTGVCVKGFIYWLERDDRPPPLGSESYSIISFDLSNDEFGKVCLPPSLQLSESLKLSKWNECLTVIDNSYSNKYDHSFNYWVMNGVAQTFTKMFRVDPIYPEYYKVFEVRKNGEAITETRYANNVDADPILQVYNPCSGDVNDIRIPWSGHDEIGKIASFFSISSYMETLLLLDQ